MPQAFILLQPEALSIIISGVGVEYKLLGGFLGQSPHSRKNTKEGKSLIVAQTMAVFYKHAWKLKRRREDPAEYRRLKVEAPAELSHKEEGDY